MNLDKSIQPKKYSSSTFGLLPYTKDRFFFITIVSLFFYCFFLVLITSEKTDQSFNLETNQCTGEDYGF